MINLTVDNPTSLWISLGDELLRGNLEFDDCSSKTRLISVQNILKVNSWNSDWEGTHLARIVGYEEAGGTKMTSLINAYVDLARLGELKEVLEKNAKAKYATLGMNFKMKVKGKGGCLSSFHIIQHGGSYQVFIYGKVAELPKKFTADMRLITWLLKELDLNEVPVTIILSTMFFSMVTVRSYETFFGKIDKDKARLPIEVHYDFGEYQKPTIRRIRNFKEKLIATYGNDIVERGRIRRHLNWRKGMFDEKII